MTFDEILEQVIALLRRQGRVSYPALKIRFSLDDEYLAALKAELLYVHPVRDDEGRGLAWTGDTESAQKVASPPSQPIQQPGSQEQYSPQVEFSPGPPAPDAERRHITVIFCDLVESTQLSRRLDLEDLREVVRAYQRACSEVITRFDGHIAQLLGDGLLVYFGYPHAHEDDAQRAVRTGLGILAAMGDLNTRLQQGKGIQLAVRIGIHTGLVVVGAMGGQGRQEQLALGEVPNVASRLQGLAEPNTVLISADTYCLIQGYFECRELGTQALRGVSQPIAIYQVVQESGVQSRLDIASTRGLTPLVGREQDVALLLERWEHAKAGHGQIVLLTGEGGIGKSRLVQVVKEHVVSEPHTLWECRSSPYFQNTALYPLTDFFQRALQWQPEDTPNEKLEKLAEQLRQYRLPEAETMPLLAPLLSLALPEDRYPPLNLSPQRQRQKTLETILAIMLEQAEREPVLFILEDLHWTDPTTLEFLGLLVEQVPTAALYMLLTCRPEFQPAWHHRSFLSEVTVNHLSRQQIEQMATHVAGGKALPADIIQQLVDKTDGVPLYVEEMSKALLESGHLKAVDGHYELTGTLPALAIPATLHDSLMARLDRLMTAKVIAQLGATIGRQFSYALLQAVSQGDEATLHTDLSRLVEAEIVYQRGLPPQATYTFKHALIQDAAYASLLKSTRQQYHQRIAQTLAAHFPETAQMQPELLAHHYTEAGRHAQAVGYWQQAGEHAVQRSAHAEAIAHLNQGLALLTTLPETRERTQQELALQLLLSSSLMVTKGNPAPETEDAYERAQRLCQQVGDTPQQLQISFGLWNVYITRPDLDRADALAHQLHVLTHNPAYLGFTAFYRGEFAVTKAYLEQGFALTASPPSVARAITPTAAGDGVALRSYAAWLLWVLGYPEQAHRRSQEALTLAREWARPFGIAFAHYFAVGLHQFRREFPLVQERAEVLIALAQEQKFSLQWATGQVLRGWALAMQGDAHGLGLMHQGLDAYRHTGAAQRVAYFLTLLAEAYWNRAQIAEGLAVLAEALQVVDTHGVRFYEAELHRLTGELLLSQSLDNQTEAATCFHHALDIARTQQAKSFELRAATSLSRLWQQQGKRQEAYDLLAPVYGWFTEGWDTADLQEAKALLHELEDGR
jgi:class 3 adenylate cyclase/predicted ATPase